MKIIKTDSLKGLLNCCTENLGCTNKSFVWRGEADSNWTPLPGLYRRLQKEGYDDKEITEQLVYEYETDLLCEANGMGIYGKTGGNRKNCLETLQHFGAATRLLDVTMDPFIALWFSCQNGFSNDTEGAIYKYEIDAGCFVWPEQISTWSTLTNNSLVGRPILYVPKMSNERIPAQSSAFLLTVIECNLEKGTIFTQESELISIKKIIYPAKLKSDLQKYLITSRHLNYYNVFPDVQGFAEANSSKKAFPRKRDSLYNTDDGLFPKRYSIENGR